MDRLLTPEVSVSQKDSIKIKMLELVDIYYLALDAPKTGNEVIFSPGLICFVNQPFFLLMLEIGLWLTI
jgi:RNA-dependent RNA polymerase